MGQLDKTRLTTNHPVINHRKNLHWPKGIIRVAFWPDATWKTIAAFTHAFYQWSKVSRLTLFKLVDIDSGRVQLACGQKEYKSSEDLDSFYVPFAGEAFGSNGDFGGFTPKQEEEAGDCSLRFSTTTGEIGGGSVMINEELGMFGAKVTALHEVGHALCLGHSPYYSHAMSPKQASVLKPFPKEGKWVREMFGR